VPATILLAQHKDRVAQLETQIEKQKQAVKTSTVFSTGILMVSQATTPYTVCGTQNQGSLID
jgi:hypothetical protein